MQTPSAHLLAIVEVEQSARVRCQEPGCRHSVYKAVHVVQDGASCIALGSTCFARRYGSLSALGNPTYGSGFGRKLTDEERALLEHNTQVLLARFAAEKAAREEHMKERLRELKGLASQARSGNGNGSHIAPGRELTMTAAAQLPGMIPAKPGPWPWMKPMTSMAYFKLKDGSGWVRVQRRDGQQMLAPLPEFDGWDEALPASVGVPSIEHAAYLVSDTVRAIAYLRERSAHECVSGVFAEIEAAAKAKP
ncbi:hypothetical protein GCM10007320_65060 [Pseudorhodoferax aquiterrae]|uniref:Uncharacterized protein n=1 Tax=Pseudorhodoferax aquiterrae TaxID=747304 RepID=A0ABQ3GH05_9BURK|nr:hypothetical protein [Pseudorhodoferax aquiterrae]GHD04289.1 hypothetical protein GCM10007320_65060 [Pseudorhodoferax aquiterrae]